MSNEDTLAFQIANDLLIAGVIREDISPTKVQLLIWQRLNLDPRFHQSDEIVHFRHNKRRISAVCNQVGNVAITADAAKVTCMRCLKMFRVHGTYERW